MNVHGWSISPYPNAYDFAFTIVHDADDAYSGRLAPLFDVFNSLRLKISVTAFAFWAEWADHGRIWEKWRDTDPLRAARAVPLEDTEELEFYKSLSEGGHEVGLHTASDDDDTRETIRRAFEFYISEFGNPPPVYVEHRDNLQNQQRQGSNPDSAFYITDLLNYYAPWVWTVSPSALPYNGYGDYFNVLSAQRPIFGYQIARCWGTMKELLKTGKYSPINGRLYARMRQAGSPFDDVACQRFGLTKCFRRSGKSQNASGSGFLEWYEKANIDKLDSESGLAIVYTHLNTGWYDATSHRMVEEIRQTLQDIASRNGWFATASRILDRFVQMKGLILSVQEDAVTLTNGNDSMVAAVTLNVPAGQALKTDSGILVPNGRGRINLGDLDAGETFLAQTISVP